VPFEVPDGWGWTTVENICSKIGSGSTPKGSNYAPDGILFFRSQNVYNDGVVLEDIKYISEEVHQSMIGTEVLPNDLLLNITGGSLGRCAIVPNEIDRGNVSQHVCILRSIIIKPEYLHTFILSSFFTKTMKITGSGREGLPKYNLEKMLLPVPPLEEQTRIIHELNKWNDWVIAIDNNQQDLVETIKQTKSKILDLAIHGKLVPQDENDEPASELLKRINPNAEITCDNGQYGKVTFEIPYNWCWQRLGDINDIARGGSPRPIKDYLTDDEDGVNWIKIGDTSKDEKYINSVKEKIRVEGVKKSRMVHKGDFLLTNSMSFGRPYILNVDGCIHDGWLVISPKGNAYNADFLYYLLSSTFAYDQFAEVASGGVVTNLNSDKVADTMFPLPPLPEQYRIVAKIEELFTSLDNIQKALEV
jgi:type I restriction enzyme S subunit